MKKKVVTQISLFEFSCCCCCCWALVCNTQQGYINDVVSRLLSRRFNFLCVVDLPIEKYGKIEKNFHGKQEEESARLEGVTQHLWERYIYWKAAEESDQQQNHCAIFSAKDKGERCPAAGGVSYLFRS